MKTNIRIIPFLIGILVLGACSQRTGYKIEGSASLPEFEGKNVYMKDALTDMPIDSTKVTNGKFEFSDTVNVTLPMVKVLSIHTGEFTLEYRLPVVLENGIIRAHISDMVSTEGTVLNDRMQDFLLAVYTYSSSNDGKTVEEIKSGFSKLLRQYIEVNNDNVVGSYIKSAYEVR